MDTAEKINLWLKMGQTLGVPQKQLQAVRPTNRKFSDGVYRVSWTDRFGGDSALEAANLALVKLFANGDALWPSHFVLTVEGKDGETSIDYSGAALLKGLEAGLERCYPTPHSDVTQQAEIKTSETGTKKVAPADGESFEERVIEQ